ncbi:MAG: phospholipase effector Tle1 domain-containing protein [Pseudomonadota bacterium]
MQLKYPRELTAQDLPLIETPFFAADRVKSVLSSYYSHERARLTLPHSLVDYSRSPRLRAEQLCARVAAGELLLVYSESERSQLFSPVVSWRPEDSPGQPGRWVFEERPMSCHGVRDAVTALNRNGVKPCDLKSAMGIGGARTGDIDAEVRRQRIEREHRRPESFSVNGASGNATAVSMATAPHVVADVKPKKQGPSEEPPLEIVAGLFTDGTLNNVDNIREFQRRVEEQCLAPMREDPSRRAECEERLRLLMGESYAGAPTNVAKLWQLYWDSSQQEGDYGPIFIKVYSPGAGTKTRGEDSVFGMATGLGETGVPQQVQKLFVDLALQIKDANSKGRDYQLTLDLFGFSRGAAAARHAVNEILKGQKGALATALGSERLRWPISTKIRFVGLFDTVAGIANLSEFDFSPGDERTSPVNIFVDPSAIERAVHLTARHEKRANFSMNSLRDSDGKLPENFQEYSLPGSHSDIGGGYPARQVEDILLMPVLSIRGSQARWPTQTMEWDNLESLRNRTAQAGWIGEFSKELPSGEQPSLNIEQRELEHPLPDGQVLLSLRMRRFVLGDYANVTLRIMHRLARETGVPLSEISESMNDIALPRDLEDILEEYNRQIKGGKTAIDLDQPKSYLLLQRYLHHSDHYNLMKSVVNDTLVNYEFPFQEIHPFRATADRNRIIHPNLDPGLNDASQS